jgi:hypothetical protein
MIKQVYLFSRIENFYSYIKILYNNQSIIIAGGLILITGR